jgi:hypothetical protein
MRKARPLAVLFAAAALFVLALGAVPAQAEFGLENWEALTCKENVDTPALPGLENAITGEPPLEKDANQCTGKEDPEGPNKWFTQATGHPNFGITDFTLNTLTEPGAVGFPDGFVKDIQVDLPEGLGVNPEAAPACTTEQAEKGEFTPCVLEKGPGVIVGTNYFTIALEQPGAGCLPDGCLQARVNVPVFNVEPFDGVPSMVAFPTSGGVTFIVGDLNPEDQSITFRISDIEEPPAGPPVVGSRLVFNGLAGDGTYLTMPSNCAGGQVTTIHVESHDEPPKGDTEDFETAVGADDCETAPFEPAVETTSGGVTDSPEPATVDVQMPKQLEGGQRGQSHLLKATIKLPEGTALNPSSANGLLACTDAQFKKGSDDPIACPAASRIGSAEVETEALDQKLDGDVYVGQPLSNDPASGELFRIFIHVFNNRYGVNVRLVGNVFPDLKTGQLTTVVPNNPQAPFNSFKVTIEGGPKGALSSPFVCGPHTTTAIYNPWSRPGEDVTETSQTSQTSAPGGGPCPQTLGERPFNPGMTAGTRDRKAGAYSPFDLHVSRPDGAQELKQLDVTLPRGMSAKLKGVEYCPENRIAAAAGNSGAGELAIPSCPASSLLGRVATTAGTGSNPLSLDGSVYMAGPYKGAPLSLVTVTPAVAGPYDLGTVVVRAALYVDPETAVVNAVSDPIPDVFGGVRLDIRAIDISIDRAGYTINPTTCREETAVAAKLYGGNADPADPNAWVGIRNDAPFRATDCKALQYKPTFYARILGGKKQARRTANPRFQAILKARNGDANLRRAAFILPKATILDQGHINTVCTRVQLAADSCPQGSIYGHAKATTPLLDGNLKGPVYLTSSDNQLPDMVVDLRGQVNVRLRGVISSVKGRLKTVFPNSPDVAVNKFTLNMKGGKQGLLVNTVALCARKRFGYLKLKAQNNRQLKRKRLRLHVPACKKGKKKRGGKR